MQRVDVEATENVGSALSLLGFEGRRPVIVIAGSASNFEEAQRDLVKLFFDQVVAPVCEQTGSAVIYGGTRAGVMEILGQSISEYAPSCALIGVVPKALAPLGTEQRNADAADIDPRQTHLLRTPGTCWGDESSILVGVAERLALEDHICVIALSGGPGTVRELELAARRGWPVLLATGCGGKVDELAKALGQPPRQSSLDFATLIDAGEAGMVRAAPVVDRDLTRRLLQWRLSTADVLREAWGRFAIVDRRATADKPKDRRTKLMLLILGLLATLSAIVTSIITTKPWHYLLLSVVITAPLLASVLIALQGRQLRGSRWIPYRSAAEAIRREIYRFRTGAEPYLCAGATSPAELLSLSLATIDQHAGGRSAVPFVPTTSRIWPPNFDSGSVHVSDALLDRLDGDRYAKVRVWHQLDFYADRLSRADRVVEKLLPVAFIAATIATVVGALGYRIDGIEIWVALATSASAAALAWLDYDQAEQRAHAMANSAGSLRSAHERWLALPPTERGPEAVSRFAEDVEDALGAEAADWNRALRQAQRAFRA